MGGSDGARKKRTSQKNRDRSSDGNQKKVMLIQGTGQKHLKFQIEAGPNLEKNTRLET